MNSLRPIVQGDDYDCPIQCVLAGGENNATFAAGDILTAYLYRGQNQTPLFTSVPVWYTAGGTQTGYGQGQVLFTVSSLQSLTLEPNGQYLVGIQWSPAATPTRKATIARAMLPIQTAPGTDTQTILPYCQLKDMLRYADWISTVQDQDSDQESFYPERLLARQWMDDTIVNNYRGSFVGLFEGHSITAFAFGNTGWRRSLGPSPSLITYLAQNMLILDPPIIEACAYKAISYLGMRQVGINAQLAQLGFLFDARATRRLSDITACINTGGSTTANHGTLFINLNSTNTLMT